MVIAVNCETCAHSAVCKYKEEIDSLQERLDEALEKYPNNLRYKVEWSCIYRKGLDNVT